VPCSTGIARLDRVEDRAERDGPVDRHLDFAPDAGQRLEVLRQLDADHGSVCTSTESTAGRSRTIGVHVSPRPPTHTPAAGRAEVDAARVEADSTAIASRSTFT
jgi:hypothetical protein